MPNPLRQDPSRTTTLRRRFIADVRRRFKIIEKAIQQLVVDDDVFGLKDPVRISFNVEKEAWRFRTDSEKVESFRKWFQGEIEREVLSVDVTGKPWTAEYVDSAYKKGVIRAYTDTRREVLEEDPVEFYRGSREEFLKSTFGAPESVRKIELLSTRTFEELRGVSSAMAQQMSRVLSSGLANGLSPLVIARTLRRTITGLTKRRAETIARTEIIRAHAEGQLDSFERLGVSEVGIMAEWSTAGDDSVCDMCLPLDGEIMTVKEARGLLPRHPNAVFQDSTFVPYGHALELVRAWYSGPSIVLLAGNYRTSIGPNHPMVTSRGIVRACEIQEGDKVVYDLRHNNFSLNVFEIDHKKVPTVQNVFQSTLSATSNVFISSTGSDFHGDVRHCQGKIETIHPTRGLLLEFDSCGVEKFAESDFVFADSQSSLMSSKGSGSLGSGTIDLASSSSVCGTYPWISGDFIFLTVTHVEISSFTGWAYDASVEHSSLYCNNGFVVKNCRCAYVPAVDRLTPTQDKNRQKSLKHAIDKSFQGERVRPRSKREARARSSWLAKEKRFGAKAPAKLIKKKKGRK